MDIKFTVKELSRIVGVSSRKIRYYDEIGLFRASGSFDNGYRYYTIDKIEEIGIINYLRHMGVPIKDIKKQLENRNIDEYESILDTQLNRVNDEIIKLHEIKSNIEKRKSSVNFVKNLPSLGTINIQTLESKHIIKLERKLNSQLDWELALIDLDNRTDTSPSIFIGDIGFFVDLDKVSTRKAEEFSGMFLLIDDHINNLPSDSYEVKSGNYLCLYVKGDHHSASSYYSMLLDYADKHKLTLGKHAFERTLLDHFISSDSDLYITEILIPILDK